jgi:hypothetical protein
MIPDSYNSFDEIDNNLKILKLKREIYKEHLKLNLNATKMSLYPVNIMSELRESIQKKALLFIAEYLLKKFR